MIKHFPLGILLLAAATAIAAGDHPQGQSLTECSEPVGPSMVAGPYVVDISSSSATVMVQTSGQVTPTVFLAEYVEGCNQEAVFASGTKVAATRVVAKSAPFVECDSEVPDYLYQAEFDLAEAAESDRRFCYGLEWPGPSYSPDTHNRYFCPPELSNGNPGTSFVVPAATGTAFSFYVYGDVRDPVGFSNRHQAVAQGMVRDLRHDLVSGVRPAGFVISSGDFAYSGCAQGLWLNNFFAPARLLLQVLPLFTAPGNHEYYEASGGPSCSDAAFYFSYFGASYDPEKVQATGIYSFDYLNSRFISLNLTSHGDWGGPGKGKGEKRGQTPPSLDPAECSGQKDCGDPDICAFEWLRCQLLEAQAKSSIDHVFVFYHAPMITAPPIKKHGSSDFQIKNLAPLLERPDGVNPGKVVAVFNGHNHLYERSAPLLDLCLASDSECRARRQSSCPEQSIPEGFKFPEICYNSDDEHGITYLIAGGGGATPYDAPPGPFPIRWLEVASNAYHFVKITVDGSSVHLKTTGINDQGQPPFSDQAMLRKAR